MKQFNVLLGTEVFLMLEELKKIYRIIVSFPPDLEDNEDELTTEVPSDTSTQDPPLWGDRFARFFGLGG